MECPESSPGDELSQRKNIQRWREAAKLTEKRETVPGSRIRNEILQFAQLKPAQSPIQIGSGGTEKKKKGTDDVFARRLEAICESGVILEHSDVLWLVSVGRFKSPIPH